QKADIGLSPSSDGNLIRTNIPTLTQERRKDLLKVVGKYAEESRVQLRNIRREANNQLKQLEEDSEITEADLKGYQADVQKKTDDYIDEIDQLVKSKEAEILEV